ncbi:MAG: osmotically inducible protein C [Bacteroidetes bacterium]|nr:MAG: osmotically inducible protein C [Bacteroidota bacterium]
MKAEKVYFTNQEGLQLSGQLQKPVGQKIKAYALFAHCFTCGKDLKAVRNLSESLNQKNIAVLRFDFSGLGQSEGDFASTNFSTNINDLLSAAQFMAGNNMAPEILIGHSLGGSAVLMVADKIPSVKAVATIGAPSEAEHVKHLFQPHLNTILEEGDAEVNIGGRPFVIKKQFLHDLEGHAVQKSISKWRKRGLLVMHSPQDTIVGIENAREIYEAAHHPKSYISLDGADHLLSKSADSEYVGLLIASWANRYLAADEKHSIPKGESQVIAQIDEEPFITRISANNFGFIADEPEEMGGQNLGPSPYDLVSAGLAACTAMTMQLYARHKKFPLEGAKVEVNYEHDHASDAKDCVTGEAKKGLFHRKISLQGPLDEKQKARILSIANKCPVHKSLEKGTNISTEISD